MGRPRTIDDAELLRHARAVFLRQGGSGSTKEIATLAGVSEAALFKRYSTKTALFLAAMMPPEVDVVAILAPATRLSDPRRALTAVSENMLDYFRNAIPVFLQLMANPSIRLQDVVRHFKVSPAPALVDAIAGWLREAAKDGRVAATDPRASAGLLVAAVHSIAQFELFGLHGGKFPRTAVATLVGALWDGLKPPISGRDPAIKRTATKRRSP